LVFTAGKQNIMVAPQTLSQVMDRLESAMTRLEDRVDRSIEQREDFRDAEEEVQRLNTDRSRLAAALDESEARAERLETVNKEVSRRLVTAMETIRAVLDR
jgi:chromosome segregation ATPase